MAHYTFKTQQICWSMLFLPTHAIFESHVQTSKYKTNDLITNITSILSQKYKDVFIVYLNINKISP